MQVFPSNKKDKIWKYFSIYSICVLHNNTFILSKPYILSTVWRLEQQSTITWTWNMCVVGSVGGKGVFRGLSSPESHTVGPQYGMVTSYRGGTECFSLLWLCVSSYLNNLFTGWTIDLFMWNWHKFENPKFTLCCFK